MSTIQEAADHLWTWYQANGYDRSSGGPVLAVGYGDIGQPYEGIIKAYVRIGDRTYVPYEGQQFEGYTVRVLYNSNYARPL